MRKRLWQQQQYDQQHQQQQLVFGFHYAFSLQFSVEELLQNLSKDSTPQQ